MTTCPKCFKPLEWTGPGPGWMNSEQWDAIKAGDRFTEQCNHPTGCIGNKHENGNFYFWDSIIAKMNDITAENKGWQ